MLLLLSPAKSLDWSPVAKWIDPTTPELAKESKALASVMKKKSAEELQTMMKLSEKLATLNHERFQAMTSKPDAKRDRPAALAFNGDVYKGLQARTLEARELKWSQQHVVILSGLYGALRPLDLIEPYRLEMGTRLETKRGASLYDYWGDSVTKLVNERLEESGAKVVLNLASNEYSRSVQFKKLDVPVITPVFQEISADKHKVISFFAKRARGAMARHIIDKRLTDVDDIKRFKDGGYKFDESLSSEKTWVFARPKPESAAK
ncbi:MAG: peroxide stress protein YaaA [Polyangiales bacterium]